MKLKNVAITAMLSVAIALSAVIPANAQPASPLVNGGFLKPAQLVPDTSFCENADTAAKLGACVAGLTNQYRNSAGLTPNPGYSYVSWLLGLTVFPPCGYSTLIALYCDGNVRLGEQTLKDIFELGISPQAYGTFLASHEAAHHSQTVVGGADLVSIFIFPTVKPYELQADCIGGMTIGKYVALGRFSHEDAVGITTIMDRAPTSSTHGSAADRKDAFWTGYSAISLSDCMGGKFASRPLSYS